jgi:RNA polymerase sigma-54 factor
MYQAQYQEISPQTTAHLAQTMTLLNMTSAELRQKIEAELASNPALEIVEPHRCRACGKSLLSGNMCPICSQLRQPDSLEPIVFTSPRDDYYQSTSSGSSSQFSAENLPDDNIAPDLDLPAFVLRQIAPEINAEDHNIVAHILTSLDEDGLLRFQPLEISQYHHVPLSRVTNIIKQIQYCEPVGVGSTSPQEALLVQLEVLSKTQEIPHYVEKAIQEGMDTIGKYHFAKLGKMLGISTSQAEEITNFISNNLNPYPARSHWGSIRQGTMARPQVYQHPDILIGMLHGQENGPLVIEILFPLRGSLRVNPLFQKELKKAPEEKSEKWQQDHVNATLLIKCLRQRENTMRQMLTIITQYQREFILNGDKYLRPITRASLAQILDVHESTVSRAVAGKTTQLPNGRIIPLSKFFDRSLPIRTLIREMIDEEHEVLTDSQIAELLEEDGYQIARRTVAKYRSMEGILSARSRKNIKMQVA